jgi:hypothetical protein
MSYINSVVLTFKLSLCFWYTLTALNSGCRKYNEPAHAACLTNPIIQPSLGVSPNCIPLPTVTLASHREHRYDLTDSSWVSVRFYFMGSVLIPQTALALDKKMVT